MRHLTERSIKLIQARLHGEEEVASILKAIGNRIGFLKDSGWKDANSRISELTALENQIHNSREPLEVQK